MLVNPNVPAKNLQELIRLAKAKPKSLAFGSGGIGTGEHLVLELFLRRAGVDLVHVPYKGGTAVFTDLIGGQIQGRFSNELAATPFVRSGQLRAIAITGSERSKGLPELPTFDEQGVRGLETFAWWGVMGPSGIPAEASAKLNALFNASLASAEVRQRLVALGATVQGGSSAKFGEFFRAETELWSGIIKEANIRAE